VNWNLIDGILGAAVEIGGTLLIFSALVAVLALALAVPPMLFRWAVRELRAKCFRPSRAEFRKMKEAA
jgi:hypothetical protein